MKTPLFLKEKSILQNILIPHVNNKILFYTVSGPRVPLKAVGWPGPGSWQVGSRQASGSLGRTRKDTPFLGAES